MRPIEILIEAIPKNKPIRLGEGDAAVVVVRTDEGISAFPDVCPHAHWKLSAGEIVNGAIECPGHGWEFELRTGRCRTVPSYSLTCLQVDQFGDRLLISRKSSPIPSLPCLDQRTP